MNNKLEQLKDGQRRSLLGRLVKHARGIADGHGWGVGDFGREGKVPGRKLHKREPCKRLCLEMHTLYDANGC
jgi:hypothetical protein